MKKTLNPVQAAELFARAVSEEHGGVAIRKKGVSKEIVKGKTVLRAETDNKQIEMDLFCAERMIAQLMFRHFHHDSKVVLKDNYSFPSIELDHIYKTTSQEVCSLCLSGTSAASLAPTMERSLAPLQSVPGF